MPADTPTPTRPTTEPISAPHGRGHTAETAIPQHARHAATDTARIRADLDTAITAALSLSGGRVRPALHRLRNALAEVDRCNARFATPEAIDA